MKKTMYLMLLIFCVSQNLMASYDILLDTSASMQGFKNERRSWIDFLQKFQKSSLHKYRFGEKNKFFKIEGLLEQVPLQDKDTFLGEAIQHWLNVDENNSSQIAVIITDNIADTGNQKSQVSQKILTDLLSARDRFSHISIFALRLPFSGKVYYLGKGNGFHQYRGPRALVVYLLGKKGITDNEFFKTRESLAKEITQFDIQLFQPTDKEVTLGEVSFDFTQEKNKVDLSYDNNKLLIKNYTLGKPLNFTLNTSIEIKGGFQLNDIDLIAKIKLKDLPEHLTNSSRHNIFEATVTPNNVVLTPYNAKNFKINFNIQQFSFSDIPIHSKLKYAMNNKQILEGDLEILFTASKDNYQIYQPVLQDWNYSGANAETRLGDADQQIQSKVYNLRDIVVEQVMTENVSVEKLTKIPLQLEIKYSIALILFVCFLLIILAFIIWYLLNKLGGQGNHYILLDDMQNTIPLPTGIFNTYRHYEDKNDLCFFSITFLGFAYWVTSQHEFSGTHLLGKGQNFTVIADDYEYSWELRKEDESDGEDDYEFDDW